MEKFKNIKKDFPIFKERIIYLDNAATTQKPKEVIESIKEYYEKFNGNADRGLYFLSLKSSKVIEKTRRIIANLINSDPEEIIFTKNATESLNILAYSLENELVKKEEIVSTENEHHSNFIPWQQLAKRKKVKFKIIQVDKKNFDFKNFEEQITKETKIVTFSLMSNVSGKIYPAKEIINKIRKIKKDVIIILDATQAIAHIPINVKELDCDFLCFSSHKIYGPFGVGVLFGKKELLKKLNPVLFGGGMVLKVTKNSCIWKDLPKKFEAGSPDCANIYGLGKAIEYLKKINLKDIFDYENELKNYTIKKLYNIKNIRIFGHGDDSYGPIISFFIDKIHPHDIADICAKSNICIRAGSHCAQLLMRRLGISSSVRVSLSFYNDIEDIEKLIFCLNKISKILDG
ncbi:MAG: aminotransferase class V-fold PLP-dependent enzyme [Candidatus Pacearchaeota archaeon]